jgi:hypothetical protein
VIFLSTSPSLIPILYVPVVSEISEKGRGIEKEKIEIGKSLTILTTPTGHS